MSRTPSFGEAMESAFGAQLGQLRAIEPGEVTYWSRGHQAATVRPLILGPNRAARAEVPRCAVVFPGAYWDIQLGETGLLLVCDEDYHRWWRDDEAALPATAASHSIGSSVFLPGLKSLAQKRTLPADATVLEKPIALGTVRLGVHSATKAVVHEDIVSALGTYHVALATWGVTIGGAPAWVPVQTAWDVFVATIATYTSPSVKVEN